MSNAIQRIREHLPQLLHFAEGAKQQADFERSRSQFINTDIVARETLLTFACALAATVIELDTRLSLLETDGK
jgi:hypothetical protein